METAKNILFIIDTFGGGGAEKALIEILNRIDHTFNISILAYTSTGIYKNALSQNTTVYTILKSNTSIIYKIIKRFNLHKYHAGFKARRLLKGKKFDTIVSYMEGPPAMIHLALTHLANKNITWLHTDTSLFTWDKQYTSKKEKQALYNAMDHIVAVGDNILSSLRNSFYLKCNCSVIPNIVDKSAISANARKEKIPKRRFTICGVGRLIECKHWERAISAIAILKQKKIICDLWIVGQGHLIDTLKDQANDLKVNEMVHFTGFTTNPYAYMSHADVSVIASDVEGMPLTLIESSMLGTPIITTPCCSIAKEYGNFTDSLIDFTPIAIANKIEEIYSDKSKLEQMQLKTIEFSKKFDPDIVMQKINLLFN